MPTKRGVRVALLLEEVDEDSKYKGHPSLRDIDYVSIAETFVARYRNWKQGNQAETTLPSMIMTFEELKQFGL